MPLTPDKPERGPEPPAEPEAAPSDAPEAEADLLCEALAACKFALGVMFGEPGYLFDNERELGGPELYGKLEYALRAVLAKATRE